MNVRRTATAAIIVAVIAVGLVWAFIFGGLGLYSGHPTTTESSPLYTVEFKQSKACSSTFWGEPWGVTINSVAVTNGATKTQPPGTTLPITSLQSTTDATLSEITFSLHDGSYLYTISPSPDYFTPSSGAFVVSGSNVTIQVAYTGTSCIALPQP